MASQNELVNENDSLREQLARYKKENEELKAGIYISFPYRKIAIIESL